MFSTFIHHIFYSFTCINSSFQRTVDHHKYRVDDSAQIGDTAKTTNIGGDSILRHPALETRVAALLSRGFCGGSGGVGSFVEEGVDCVGLFDATNFFSDECKEEIEEEKKKKKKRKKKKKTRPRIQKSFITRSFGRSIFSSYYLFHFFYPNCLRSLTFNFLFLFLLS